MEHATQVTPENITPLELTRELEKEDANVTEEVQEASEEAVAEVTGRRVRHLKRTGKRREKGNTGARIKDQNSLPSGQ